MNLGETIHQLRLHNNLSQEALADALGVSRQSVSKWENGNAVPELDKLVKMSALFSVSLDELVGNQPAPSPHPRENPQDISYRTIDGRSMIDGRYGTSGRFY